MAILRDARPSAQPLTLIVPPSPAPATVYDQVNLRGMAAEALLSERPLLHYLTSLSAVTRFRDMPTLLATFLVATVGGDWVVTPTHFWLAGVPYDAPILLQEWAQVLIRRCPGTAVPLANVLAAVRSFAHPAKNDDDA